MKIVVLGGYEDMGQGVAEDLIQHTAGMLARGESKLEGVYAPEGCLEPTPFFAELGKRDIQIEKIAS